MRWCQGPAPCCAAAQGRTRRWSCNWSRLTNVNVAALKGHREEAEKLEKEPLWTGCWQRLHYITLQDFNFHGSAEQQDLMGRRAPHAAAAAAVEAGAK